VKTGGFAFPHTRRLRVQLRRASSGIRNQSAAPEEASSTRHADKRADAPGSTKEAYTFADTLSTGRATNSKAARVL
jgi:hypothetical protein